jgi:hypothetical protein
VARTNDIGLLPDYLKNNGYEEAHVTYSARLFSLEIHERQSFYSQINDFENYYRNPKEYKGRFYIGVQLTLLHKQHIEALPPEQSELTIEEYIEIDRDFYFKKLQAMSERLLVRNRNPEDFEKEIIEKEKWDSRPYIRPITNMDPTLQKEFDITFNDSRRQFAQVKNQVQISLNLDFSNNAILEELETHLKFLRKQKGDKFKKPKDKIHRLKQQKILQVMDVYLWQQLSNIQIEYEPLAGFLYPHGKFSGKKLGDEIWPLAESLLDSRSIESQFLFYRADKEYAETVT